VNGISGVHQAFLNAGGLGILVGDGQLPNYGSERIVETYYSFPVFAWRMTFDYQFITNPAYNRDPRSGRGDRHAPTLAVLIRASIEWAASARSYQANVTYA
jgi:Carbohydrate-selective porin, OprB family